MDLLLRTVERSEFIEQAAHVVDQRIIIHLRRGLLITRDDRPDLPFEFIGLGFILFDRGRDRIHLGDRKSTRLNSSHVEISYAVFCLKKKKKSTTHLIHTKKQKKQHINKN